MWEKIQLIGLFLLNSDKNEKKMIIIVLFTCVKYSNIHFLDEIKQRGETLKHDLSPVQHFTDVY